MSDTNDQLVLICGESGTGKSTTLRNIREQEKWFYLNCEAGKRLPFKNKFKAFRIEDPLQVHEGFEHGTNNPEINGIVVDTSTFMMDMFETQYVNNSANTQKAWGDYSTFWKVLMQQKVVAFGKPVIILAHTRAEYDEKLMDYRTSVPVKGALKNNGIEAYFSTVVACKKLTLKELEKYQSKLLNITEQEKMLGFKHVFQTQITAKTVNERIRSPMGLFSEQETFIDNDAQILLDRLHEYYKND